MAKSNCSGHHHDIDVAIAINPHFPFILSACLFVFCVHVLVGTAVHVHFVVLLHLEHLSTHHLCFVVQKWCKACVLLEGLNRGLPKLGIGRSRGLNNDHTKGAKESNGTKSFESKQCGTLDF